MDSVHVNSIPENQSNDFNKEVDKVSITPSKQSANLVSSAHEIAELSMQSIQAQQIETPSSSNQQTVSISTANTMHLSPVPRPVGDLEARVEEHNYAQQEQNLLVALNNLDKQAKSQGGLVNQVKQVANHPIQSAGKATKKTAKATKTAATYTPFVGSVMHSHRRKKEAMECHEKAKALKKEIANPNLSAEEAKSRRTEIKKQKKEIKILKQGLKQLDNAIADEYEDSVSNRMQGRVEARTRLVASIKAREKAILETRCKLYDPAIPEQTLKDKIAEIDQLLIEQKKHVRKSHGHDVYVAHPLASGLVPLASGLATESEEILRFSAELALESATAAGNFIPVLGPAVNLPLAVVKGSLKARNVKKAIGSLSKLKELKREAKTCQALADHYEAVSLDPKQSESTREAGRIEMEVELEKVKVIKDYSRIQKKYIHSKIVHNSLGLAAATSSVGASVSGLLVLIPEPTTSATMYGLSLGLTGVKIGFTISEFIVKEGSKVLEAKSEKKLWQKRDFFEAQEHTKGISRSFLGVEIRLAHMIKQGFAPVGVVEYHGIVDEQGYIKKVSENAQALGDKQELKKGIAVITEYKTFVEDYYSQLAQQRNLGTIPPKEVE